MRNEYWIHVTHVDNRMVIYLNGETLWDSGIVHDDPTLDHYIEVTRQLEAHPQHISELIFEGFNDSYNAIEGDLNPWHFTYRVIRRSIDEKGKVVSETDMIIPYDEKHLSNPNMRAINNTYQFMKKGDEFRVVSNALSQQFYR